MRMTEIAKLAGVSTSTVSRVFHGSPLVNPKTAQRVRAMLNESRYVPDSLARGLQSGVSNIYGLVITDITNPFFPEILKEFESIGIERNREVMLSNIDFHRNGMGDSVRRLLAWKVHGVAILTSAPDQRSMEDLAANSIPMVTLDRRIVGPGLSDVAVDNLPGMVQAIKYLKNIGHVKIGYIGGLPGEAISKHRSREFMSTLRNQELIVRPEYIREGDFRMTGGATAVQELLALSDPPTAILAGNDMTAIGALHAAQRMGFHIGRDISIVGLDDIAFAEIIVPALTTLHLSRPQMARSFFDALDYFEPHVGAVGQQYTVTTSLVIRDSTGPVKVRKVRRKIR
jgi:DNA-binding LacI/PurR family transcriptional regulator